MVGKRDDEMASIADFCWFRDCIGLVRRHKCRFPNSRIISSPWMINQGLAF
jgi:hypothetical protein